MSSVLTSLSTSRKSMRGNYRASAASPMQFSSRKDILHSTLRRASKQAIASRLRLLPSCSAQSAIRNVAPVPPRPVGAQTPAVRRKISPQMVHANLRERERHLEPRRRGLPSGRKTDRYPPEDTLPTSNLQPSAFLQTMRTSPAHVSRTSVSNAAATTQFTAMNTANAFRYLSFMMIRSSICRSSLTLTRTRKSSCPQFACPAQVQVPLPAFRRGAPP